MANPGVKCVVWDLDNTIWDGILLEDAAVTLKPRIREVIETLDRRGILHSIASRNDRDLSAQGWRPTGQPAGQATTSASAQHSDRVPGADADNYAAVAAYRLSVKAGNPLSERKLAQMFGRTSRRWARARIAEGSNHHPTE